MEFARVVARLRTPAGAALVLAVSLAAYAGTSMVAVQPFQMIDLRVYVEATAHLWTDNSLYSFSASVLGLPFTYPPFAALVFSGVAWLPWDVVRCLWQVGAIAALAAVCDLSLRAVGGSGRAVPDVERRSRAALLAAGALWIEPVRATVNFGQVNLYLTALLLLGLVASRTSISGVTLGLCTAVKLIPGVTVLYYLLAGRLKVIAVAVAVGGASVLVSWWVAPRTTRLFLTEILFQPARAGDLASVNNQSLRGAIARILRHDSVGWWVLACLGAVVLGVAAARLCLRRDDRLGAFLAIQLTGLLISPISWTHHWVWVLPLLIWLRYGPLRDRRTMRTLGLAWLLAVVTFVVGIQITFPEVFAAVAGNHVAWLQAVYTALGVVTLVTIGVEHRRAAAEVRHRGDDRSPAAPSSGAGR